MQISGIRTSSCKSIFPVFIIVFLFLITASCKNQIEEEVTKSPDGKVEKVTQFKKKGDAKEMVKETRFYSNGNKKIEGAYKEGQKDGKWIYWYDNGDVWSEGFYDKGIRTGETKVYSKDNKLIYTGTYKKGKAEGVWIFYDAKGNKEKEVTFSEGTKVKENSLKK